MKRIMPALSLKCALGVAVGLLLMSCGQSKVDENLLVKLSPNSALVIEAPSADSCTFTITGNTENGYYKGGDVPGPLISFNRMSMQWTKSTKMYVQSAKITLRGSGIQGGKAACDISKELDYLFSDDTANTNRQAAIYTQGAFIAPGTVVSDPRCRIPCTVPLEDPEKPEISAVGELIIKGTEVTNEGLSNEVDYRVRSRFVIRIRP